MARKPDQIEQEIRALRQEISARVDNLKDQGTEDLREAADGVKSIVADPIASGMHDRPYMMLGGALATGVVVGLASGKIPLPSLRNGSQSSGHNQVGGSTPGWLSAWIAAAEGAAISEGTDAVRSWLHSTNGHQTGPEQTGEPDNELGTSIPPPVP